MRKLLTILIIVIFFSNLCYSAVTEDRFVPGELIIKAKDEAVIEELGKEFELKSVRRVFKDICPTVYRVNFPSNADITAITNKYQANPDIEYVHPNYILKAAVSPSDEYFNEQWALDRICAPAAWDIEQGTDSVIIAVMDTGVDLNHLDLAGNLWVNDDPIDGADNDNNGYTDDTRGWNFVNADNDPSDDNGHGTAIAGVIAGIANNHIGIAGVCRQCKIMPIKCLDSTGKGNVIAICQAIEYAANNGAKVINISLGSYEDIPLLRDAIEYASIQGCVLVCAAGNDNTASPFYPAGYGSVTAVCAVDNGDRKSSFSNYGQWIDVSAPGDNILTTGCNNSYACLDGTSIATGFVSGLAGLIASQHPDWNNDRINQKIIESADNTDPLNPGYEGLLGNGRINLYNAVVKPKIKLNPTSGTVGTIITVNGEGFGRIEGIGIDFGLIDNIATTTTGTKGSFSTTFRIDTQVYGTKTVTASGSISGFSAADIFFITPGIISVSPTSGKAGVRVTVAGNGFGKAEGIRIDFGNTMTITTTTATLSGAFEAMFEVDNQTFGVKTITARGMATLSSAAATFTILPSQPLPDLVIAGISFTLSSVELGKGIKIGAIITNQGDVTARKIMLQYYDGETLIGRDKVIGGDIDPGQTKEKEIHWKASLPLGTHTIRVIVDPDNIIAESNENNNEGKSILVVLPLVRGAVELAPAAYQDLTQAYCYPNPTGKGEIIFANLTGQIRIKIFNITGELVYTGEHNTVNSQWLWNCKNNDGEDVASGIYIYIIEDPAGGSVKQNKLGVIR